MKRASTSPSGVPTGGSSARRRIRDRRPGEHVHLREDACEAGRDPVLGGEPARVGGLVDLRASLEQRSRSWPVALSLSLEQVAVNVVGLFEDDGTERVVDQLELGDVDVHELEAGAGQALERLVDTSSHAWTHVRILELPPQHADPQPVDRVKANRSAGEDAEEGRRLLDRTRQRAHVVARRQRAGRRRRRARDRTSA